MNHEALKQSLWVSTRCVLVQPLDEKQSPINNADGPIFGSGFIIKDVWDNTFGVPTQGSGKIHLYSCWHDITSHYPRNANTPINWIQPKYVKIIGVNVTDPNSIEGWEEITIPLYDACDKPAWEQEGRSAPHRDFNAIGISVPQTYDAFRIEIQLSTALR